MPKRASCSKSIPHGPPCAKNLPIPMRNGSPNSTARSVARVWIPFASARRRLSPRPCNASSKPVGAGEGDEDEDPCWSLVLGASLELGAWCLEFCPRRHQPCRFGRDLTFASAACRHSAYVFGTARGRGCRWLCRAAGDRRRGGLALDPAQATDSFSPGSPCAPGAGRG